MIDCGCFAPEVAAIGGETGAIDLLNILEMMVGFYSVRLPSPYGRCGFGRKNMQLTPQQEFWRGTRTIVPVLFGALPFGMVVGAISRSVGLSALETLAQTFFIYAGASQLVMLELFSQNAAIWVILLSTTVINLRFLMFSASIAPHLKEGSMLRRLLLSFILVDQVYAFAVLDFSAESPTQHKQHYYAGLGIPIVFVWSTATLIGYCLGAIVPESWSLSFFIPLMFIVVLVPAIKGWPYLVAALVSATVAFLANGLPHNLGLIVAALCGIAVGYVLDGGADEAGGSAE